METKNEALNQARAQLASIREMVAALNCDYDRLQELRDRVQDERDNLSEFRQNEAIALALTSEEAQEFADLEKAAGDCESYDDARERIEQDALSVEVRSDWTIPSQEMKPGDFRIVLCCGGPHVELEGY